MRLTHKKNERPFLRTRSVRFIMVWLIICTLTFVLYVFGCDEVERHKTLTFFFDGVPPLEDGNSLELGAVDPNAPALESEPTIISSIHEPYRQCEKCHGDPSQGVFSRKVEVIDSVPRLCYQCHQEYADLKGVLHGPVAVGMCLVCHHEHRSPYPHLLRRPEPKMCYYCHEVEVIEAINGHKDVELDECTRCHDPHAAASSALLKHK